MFVHSRNLKEKGLSLPASLLPLLIINSPRRQFALRLATLELAHLHLGLVVPQPGLGDVVLGLGLGLIVLGPAVVRDLEVLGILHEAIQEFGIQLCLLCVDGQLVPEGVLLVRGEVCAIVMGALEAVVVLVRVNDQAELHGCAEYAFAHGTLEDLGVAISYLRKIIECCKLCRSY